MENKFLHRHLAENAYRTALSRKWDTIFDGLMQIYSDSIKNVKEQQAPRRAA